MTLRLWTLGDAACLGSIVHASRPEFDLWLPGLTATLSDSATFVEQVAQKALAESAWYYCVLAGGEVVGQCSVENRGYGTAELGYWVRSDRAGLGLARRAVAVARDAAVRDGFSLLVIRCDEGNRRSAAVARRAGFVHVSTVQLEAPAETVRTGREMTWHYESRDAGARS